MTEIYCVVCLLTLSALWSPSEGDTEVSCVFNKSCILPCSFQGGIDAVIHWNHVTAGNTPVHSYYHNQDQLAHQNQRFKGRTSLFKDQISSGNASLQLTGVEVQDQGRYKCSTSTISGNKDSFINLKVDALVGKVDIQQVENRITCSSDGIYPEPRLFWSTSPPSNVTFRNSTTVQPTEQQLYNIKSSLILLDNLANLAYSCNISTRRNRRRATFRQQSSLSSPSADTTIPCGVSNVSLAGFSLVWTFNHSEVIVQTEANVSRPVSEEWRQYVKGVSESGSLTLRDLSSAQEGIYTCELSNEEETYIINTLLRKGEESQTGATGVIVAVVVVSVILVVLLAGLYLYYRHKKSSVKREDTGGQEETGVSLQ